MAADDTGPIRDLETRDQATVVHLAGEIDLNQSPRLKLALSKLAESRPPKVIINLADVEYMDSSGVATLVDGFRRINSYRGRLVLAGMNQRVRSLFEITKLDQFFTIRPSVEEALQA